MVPWGEVPRDYMRRSSPSRHAVQACGVCSSDPISNLDGPRLAAVRPLLQVPILCLDEATAAMDPHTEARVLEIIERAFHERTTLTIAHR